MIHLVSVNDEEIIIIHIDNTHYVKRFPTPTPIPISTPEVEATIRDASEFIPRMERLMP